MKDALLYGTLLGDSWIYKDKRENYLFAFSQVNKEYAMWKAELLGFPYKFYHIKRYDKRTKKYYYNLTVHIKLPVKQKKELYELFYKPKKSISVDILEKLSKKAICLWYLDDGNMYYNGNNCHLSLAVDGFRYEEQLLIQSFFKEKYNIDFKKTKKNLRLVSKKECLNFMKIVEKYIPICMDYKKLSKSIEKHLLKPKKIRKEILGNKIKTINMKNEETIWNNVKEAALSLNITPNSIYCNLSGKSKYCNKLKFEYI